MVVAEKPKTGSFRWENDWCPKCRERTTFWFVREDRTKCSQCELEKDKGLGLGLGPDDS